MVASSCSSHRKGLCGAIYLLLYLREFPRIWKTWPWISLVRYEVNYVGTLFDTLINIVTVQRALECHKRKIAKLSVSCIKWKTIGKLPLARSKCMCCNHILNLREYVDVKCNHAFYARLLTDVNHSNLPFVWICRLSLVDAQIKWLLCVCVIIKVLKCILLLASISYW